MYSILKTTTASNCVPGEYLNAPTTCTTCPQGSYCPGNNSAIKCAIGSANPLTGQTTCPLCPKGGYSDTQGSTSCIQCPKGSFSSAAGSSSCTQCGSGYESDSYNQACSICPAGEYSNSTSISCTSCPSGSVCKTVGCSNCQLCQIGYVPNSTGTDCTICGVGTFALVGDSSCTDCSPGSYASAQGSSSCKICSAGTYSLSKSSTCRSCLVGQYSNVRSASCSNCPVGTFCVLGGCSSCKACSGGTVLNSLSLTCVNCTAGTYSKDGWTVCQKCSPGYYSGAKANSCTQCSNGSFCNSTGCISCTSCPAGTSSSSDFSTCDPCPAGTYSIFGSPTCINCPVNTYSQPNSSSCIPCITGYYSASGDPICHTICGDGLRVGSEQCDDANKNPGDGCSDNCLIEKGYACKGGTYQTPDVCYIVCGDGLIIGPENCDDCNGYSGDGCSATCQLEDKYKCDYQPDCLLQIQRCILKCGDGKIDDTEQCDDGNHYNFDGCSTDCQIEKGFVCTGGSSTTVTTCLENTFMPSAKLKVLSNNNLIITFNDTITNINPTEDDLYIVIYGPQPPYEFTWTATFQDSSTLLIILDISTEITGTGETIYVDFPYSNSFISIYSQRQTNPDINLKGTLNMEKNLNTTSILGQTTLYIFLISIFISMLSSFGGNSMEMMWIFTNYLQLIYYISAINVNFPTLIDLYLPYIQICNANNPIFSEITFLVIPESKFTRGDVSDSIGSKAFYVSASDKLPWLLPVVFLFCLVKLTDFWKKCDEICCLKYIYRLIDCLKYNFFLRMCIELQLDIVFTAIVNIFFYDFSSKYEIISMSLAILFLILFLIYFCFITYFILIKFNELRIYASTFDRYSCCFCEIDSTKRLSLYWLHVYFIRRLYFCFGLIYFYQSKNIQIMVCITSSLLSLLYAIYSMPYKEKIFNISIIFNEICYCILVCTTFAFSEAKIDQSSDNFTDLENTFGNIFMGIVYFTIGVNLAYLIPSKIYEIYCIIKKIIRWCKNKVKIEAKIRKEAHNPQKNISQLPKHSTSQTTDNECLVEVVPKWKQRCIERERKNERENMKTIPNDQELFIRYENNEENNRSQFGYQTEVPTFDQYRKQISKIHHVPESSFIE